MLKNDLPTLRLINTPSGDNKNIRRSVVTVDVQVNWPDSIAKFNSIIHLRDLVRHCDAHS